VQASRFLFRVRGKAQADSRLPAACGEIAALIAPDDCDGRVVAAYLNLLHKFGLYFLQRGDAQSAESWFKRQYRVGESCRAEGHRDVRQIIFVTRLSLAMLLSREYRWREAERELSRARCLLSGKLRSEREVRWGLVRARLGDGHAAVMHPRHALWHDPKNVLACQILRHIGACG
jgi:hypothetical protein